MARHNTFGSTDFGVCQRIARPQKIHLPAHIYE